MDKLQSSLEAFRQEIVTFLELGGTSGRLYSTLSEVISSRRPTEPSQNPDNNRHGGEGQTLRGKPFNGTQDGQSLWWSIVKNMTRDQHDASKLLPESVWKQVPLGQTLGSVYTYDQLKKYER